MNTQEETTDGTGIQQPFAIVLAANKKVAQDIQDSIREETGLEAYLMAYPTDLLNMGTDNDARDIYTFLQRIAYPADNDEMKSQYYDLCDGMGETCPVRVMRVTPKDTSIAASSTKLSANKLFTFEDTKWVYRDNYWMEFAPSKNPEVSQTPFMDAKALNESLYRLGDAIKAKHGATLDYTELPFISQWFQKGIDCLKTGTRCQLDSPDTLYPLSLNAWRSKGCALLPPPPEESELLAMPKWKQDALYDAYDACDEGHVSTIDGTANYAHDFHIVYGVNHKMTNRSAYSSVTLYYYDTLTGIVAHSSEEGFAGTAAYYLGEDDPAAPYLWVRQYARDCAASGLKTDEEGGFCYSVPSDGDVKIPIGGEVMWITRMYDNPFHHAGPSADQTFMPNSIHFGV